MLSHTLVDGSFIASQPSATFQIGELTYVALSFIPDRSTTDVRYVNIEITLNGHDWFLYKSVPLGSDAYYLYCEDLICSGLRCVSRADFNHIKIVGLAK
jgi:hypothetical protein